MLIQSHSIQKFKALFVILTGSLFLTACMLTDSGGQYDLANTPYQGNTYSIPSHGNDLIGANSMATMASGENLNSVADRYDVGIVEMEDANPGVTTGSIFGSRVVVPRQYILPPKKYRRGIVINIAEKRIFYFNRSNGTVMTAPVAVGREGWHTPIGKTSVYRKVENPAWNVPKSVRDYAAEHGDYLPNVVPPGPDNPLGQYAIYLGMSGYLIHGTNKPGSIGRLVSSGCIRMYNHDVAELYSQVRKGTPVYIIYYPNKVGWSGNRLYLESHKPIPHQEGIYQQHAIPVRQLIANALAKHPGVKINWNTVDRVMQKKTGIPTMIGAVPNQA